MAEEGGTGAKPARGTRGPRIVPAARPESAPYLRLDVDSDTPLAALLTHPRQWAAVWMRGATAEALAEAAFSTVYQLNHLAV